MRGILSSFASGAATIALSELYAPAMPIQPSSTRYLKPSAVLRAEPRGKPFSAWSTNSTGRSSRPSSSASSKAIRWILLYPPSGPSSADPSQPILIGSGAPVQLLPLSAIAGLLALRCSHAMPHWIGRNEYNVQFVSAPEGPNDEKPPERTFSLSEPFIHRLTVNRPRSSQQQIAETAGGS